MKLIFLDVDGVLNHNKTEGWKHQDVLGFWVLDEECVDRLKWIVRATDAKLVLSSMWRVSNAGRTALSQAGLEFIGKTRNLGSVPRNEEILDWLQFTWPMSLGWNEEKITHMVVLDDEHDADIGDGSFVQTDFDAGGLTEEIAKEVVRKLNG